MGRSISYALMTHNELKEVQLLFSELNKIIRECDEIVVVDDFSDIDMVRFLGESGCRLFQRKLEGDFSAQRNYLSAQCTKDFIFMLDPDELPGRLLVRDLDKIVSYMQDHNIDACEIPRLNRIVGASEDIMRELSSIEDEMIVEDQDHQMRIYRRSETILWKRKVHERLYGMKTITRLPAIAGLALIHIKTQTKQDCQKELYDSISTFRNSPVKIAIGKLTKKIGLRTLLRWIRGPRFKSIDLGAL